MDVPGTIAKHRIITRECRKRHIGEILHEVSGDVLAEIVEIDRGWPKDSDVKIHVVVTIERP